MSYLVDFGIAHAKNKSTRIFESIVPDIFTTDFAHLTPSQIIDTCWRRYQTNFTSNNSVNGTIFEYILSAIFIREGLLPFFRQARVAFVPNVNYDLLMYARDIGPVSISAKTSLRERYKQADLEAVALKYVHRRAQSHLVTLDVKEGRNTAKKLETGDLMGLDSVIIATEPEMDALIERLKQLPLIKPKPIEIVSASLVISAKNIHDPLHPHRTTQNHKTTN